MIGYQPRKEGGTLAAAFTVPARALARPPAEPFHAWVASLYASQGASAGGREGLIQ